MLKAIKGEEKKKEWQVKNLNMINRHKVVLHLYHRKIKCFYHIQICRVIYSIFHISKFRLVISKFRGPSIFRVMLFIKKNKKRNISIYIGIEEKHAHILTAIQNLLTSDRRDTDQS